VYPWEHRSVFLPLLPTLFLVNQKILSGLLTFMVFGATVTYTIKGASYIEFLDLIVSIPSIVIVHLYSWRKLISFHHRLKPYLVFLILFQTLYAFCHFYFYESHPHLYPMSDPRLSSYIIGTLAIGWPILEVNYKYIFRGFVATYEK
jgi:hypothetical protein